MKIAPLGIAVLYAMPVALLLGLGISYGSVHDIASFFQLGIRGLIVAAGSVAVGVGVSQKVRFLDVEDGRTFYLRLFPLYIALFFVINALVGFELVHGELGPLRARY